MAGKKTKKVKVNKKRINKLKIETNKQESEKNIFNKAVNQAKPKQIAIKKPPQGVMRKGNR